MILDFVRSLVLLSLFTNNSIIFEPCIESLRLMNLVKIE